MKRSDTNPPVTGPKSPTKGPIAEALSICRVHAGYALLFSALINIAYLAPTLYMLQVYDRVMVSGSGSTLIFLSVALAASLATQTVIDQIRQRILLAASVRLDRVFSIRIFRKLLSNRSAGPQVRLNQALRDFDMIRAAATGPTAMAVFDAPWVPIYIIVCFFMHWQIGMLALLGSAFLICLAILNERVTKDYVERSAKANAASYASQDAAGQSADVIRAMGMTESFIRQFESGRVSANIPQLEAQQATGRVGGVIRFTRLLLQSMALGLGAWLAVTRQISPGAVFASSMLATRALAPIDQIVAQWRPLQSAATAFKGLKSLLQAEAADRPTALPAPKAQLVVDRVSCANPQKDRVLVREVAFAAQGGSVVAVIGASGAGKTTLLQAIANARGVDGGEIRFDGARYTDWDPERLARYIGYLPQDSAMFPGTVKDNISRFDRQAGRSEAEVDELAIKAAQSAGVHELILSLPQGYDTVLGPAARKLSAGQQQRVALARALYDDPVLYVLDEPNANLDGQGEQNLVQVIARLKQQGALVLLSAHRAPLIGIADYICILKDGRLEKFGTRQEVMEALRPAEPRPLRPVSPVGGHA